MIDDSPTKCDGCGNYDWMPVCDMSNKNPETGLQLYFCRKCCDSIGHEPPFSKEELESLFWNQFDIH